MSRLRSKVVHSGVDLTLMRRALLTRETSLCQSMVNRKVCSCEQTNLPYDFDLSREKRPWDAIRPRTRPPTIANWTFAFCSAKAFCNLGAGQTSLGLSMERLSGRFRCSLSSTVLSSATGTSGTGRTGRVRNIRFPWTGHSATTVGKESGSSVRLGAVRAASQFSISVRSLHVGSASNLYTRASARHRTIVPSVEYSPSARSWEAREARRMIFPTSPRGCTGELITAFSRKRKRH